MNGQAKLPGVAIIGRPNVGKSALFNRLVGRKIAIVHDQPGITRDRISAICSRGEQPFTVWDTGGIFGAGEKDLVAQVRHTAEDALRASDLLLFVVDAKDGLSPIDQDLARALVANSCSSTPLECVGAVNIPARSKFSASCAPSEVFAGPTCVC